MEREAKFAIVLSIAVGIVVAPLWWFVLEPLVGSGGIGGDPTPMDAIEAFREAGLTAEGEREMAPEDYGMAPMVAEEGVRFLIPSLGEDAGGRVMSFDSQADLQKRKEFYDSLGRESAMLFSWTFEHEELLVQINGELPEDEARRYEAALKSL